MLRENLHILLNPAAGRGQGKRKLCGILEQFTTAGLQPTVHQSTRPGALEKAARKLGADSDNTLVVAGGDGSVHEVANGILGEGHGCALAVIPVGTGNDFAKAAGLPLDWEAATRRLAARLKAGKKPQRIDAGRMNDRYFANGAGIGFDAEVGRLALSYRIPIGDSVYLLALLHAMARGIRTPAMRITGDDGELWNGPLTFANFANGPWVGGKFHIAPEASMTDGALDLFIAAPVSRRKMLRFLPDLMKGRKIDEEEVTRARINRLVVVADRDVASHIDGEIQAPASRFEIEVLPSALRIV